MHDWFRNDHVVLGQRIADKLLKQMMQEDPRAAIIALAQTLALASKECGLHRSKLMRLMETLLNAIYNPTVNTAQEAASRLLLPGNI